jgi:hypothetical protein
VNLLTLTTSVGADETFATATTTGTDNTLTVTGANLTSDDIGLGLTGDWPANTQIMSIIDSTHALATQNSNAAHAGNGSVTLKLRGPIDLTGVKASSYGLYKWYTTTLLDNTLVTLGATTKLRVDGQMFLLYRDNIRFEGGATTLGNMSGGAPGVSGTGREGGVGCQFNSYTSGNNAFMDPAFTGGAPLLKRDIVNELECRDVQWQNAQFYGSFTNLTIEDGAINNGATTLTSGGVGTPNYRTDSCTTTSGSATVTDNSILAGDDTAYRSVVGTGIPAAFNRTDSGCSMSSGSKTITDAAILSGDAGVYRLVMGPYIPSNTFVGTVTGGTFSLSSSPTTQIDVLATNSASGQKINISTNAYVGTVGVNSFTLSCVGGNPQIKMLATASGTNNLTISTTMPPWCALPATNAAPPNNPVLLSPFFAGGKVTISSISTDGHTLTLANAASPAAAVNLSGLQCVLPDVFFGGVYHNGPSTNAVQGQHLFSVQACKDPRHFNCRMANSPSDAMNFSSWLTSAAYMRPTTGLIVQQCGFTGNAQGAILGTHCYHNHVISNFMWNQSSYHIDFEPNADPGNLDTYILDNSFGAHGASPCIGMRGGAPINDHVKINHNNSTATPDGACPLDMILGADQVQHPGVVRYDYQIVGNVDGVKSVVQPVNPIVLQGLDRVFLSKNQLHIATAAANIKTVGGNGTTGISSARTLFVTTAVANFSFRKQMLNAVVTAQSGKIPAGTQIIAVSDDGLTATVNKDCVTSASGETFTVAVIPSAVGIMQGAVTGLQHDLTTSTYTPS